MVDHHPPLDFADQLRRRRQKYPVGIDDEQQRLRRDPRHRLLGGQEQSPVFLVVRQQLPQLFKRQRHGPHHDIHLFAEMGRHPGHPHGRAQAVEVFAFVAHYQDIAGFLHQLADGMRHDPGLHAGALLHHLGLAAVELHVFVDIDRRLVAAAAEGQIQTGLGLLSPLTHRRAVGGDADAQRDRNLVAGPQRPHFVENVEFLGDHPVQVRAGKNAHVGIIRILAQKTVHAAAPGQQMLVGFRPQRVALGFIEPLQHIFEIVDLNEADHGVALDLTLFRNDRRNRRPFDGIQPGNDGFRQRRRRRHGLRGGPVRLTAQK